MERKIKSIAIIAGIVIVVIIAFSSMVFVTLQPGEKGVIFRKFGSGLDKENVYSAGFHIIAPWNEMYRYDVREQKIDEGMDVLDKSGLSVHVDISVRFFPIHDRIGTLHENFGTNYIQQLVIPEVRSTVRSVMGRFTAEEIYSTRREEVQTMIINETEAVLAKEQNNIHMTALLVRSIVLPEQIKSAIETKLKQEQEALAYKYKLDKEKSEAERKRIAAEGEARANEIINQSLTTNLLKMRAIETTLKLSKSPNSKLIIMGGEDGLPVILNSGN